MRAMVSERACWIRPAYRGKASRRRFEMAHLGHFKYEGDRQIRP